MKAIVSVIGKDTMGIIARVSSALFQMKINIEDISQTIMQEYFTMIMMVGTEKSAFSFEDIKNKLEIIGKEIGVDIRIQEESIFNAMQKL